MWRAYCCFRAQSLLELDKIVESVVCDWGWRESVKLFAQRWIETALDVMGLDRRGLMYSATTTDQVAWANAGVLCCGRPSPEVLLCRHGEETAVLL